MKKFKNLMILLVFLMFAFILFSNNKVCAATDPETLIYKIAPDGKNATFKVKKPTTPIEGDIVINAYVNNLLQVEGYTAYAACITEPYTDCAIDIQSDDYNGADKGWFKHYDIKVTYDEPTANSTVNNYISKLKDFDETDPSTAYMVEDLSLINYYLTSNKSELWNPGASGRALKYSTINEITKGSNITYYLDVRAGSQDESLMYESAFGEMSIFYNDYSYYTKQQGIYLKRVIYIPQDTEDTKDAYISAAQKRINEYLGNESVVVSYGGLLNTLPEYSEDIDYPITSDGNYYNIKIGSRTYKFYIVKASSDKLVAPTYEGLDIESKIEITSKDSAIPLDTALTVKNVEDSSIKDKIGTENYKSYDISLYSAAKDAKIEKLDNGEFSVKIPVPTELEGKDLTVYYITKEGKTEEHKVIVKDGYATFTTNHFSIYTLAEKKVSAEIPNDTTTEEPSAGEKDETPKTGTTDIVNYVLAVTIISAFGIVVLNKKETK